MIKVVCIPKLSLSVLLLLKLKKGYRNSTIFIELFPRYIRAMMRGFSISETKMIAFVSVITGFEIKKIPHGDKIENYNNIRLNVYIKIVDFCEKFIPHIKNDPWFPLLQKLIDNSASVAPVTKYLAHHQMHLYLLSAKLCKHANNKEGDKKIVLIGPSYWPTELYQIIKQDEEFCDIDYYQLPSIFKIFSKVCSIYKLTAELIISIFKNGITFHKINKKSYNVATELFDPEKIGGSPFDTDFFIDNKVFTYANSLFYITEKNNRLLKKYGYGKRELKRFSEKRNIHIASLKDFSFTARSVSQLLIWHIKIIRNCFRLKGSIVSNLMPQILREHLNYLPLFLYFDIKHHIHFLVPNGRAPLCLNSGIVTSLCRQYNVHSCGIQNRTVDARQYEFCFDSYDTYFFWGQAWIDALGSALDFVKKIVIVGIFNLSEQTFQDAAKKKSFFHKDKHLLTNPIRSVIIFPTDINIEPSVYSGSFYPFSYVIDFLEVCLTLAKKYPTIRFICKPKDKHHIGLIKENSEFKKLNAESINNFEFVQKGRMNYMDLLLNADLAISIGFTAPGVDAILLKKKSIYYSKLKNGGSAFKRIPNFVAENKDNLISIFDNLNELKTNIEPSDIDLLDPYQDGKSIKRIIQYLSTV